MKKTIVKLSNDDEENCGSIKLQKNKRFYDYENLSSAIEQPGLRDRVFNRSPKKKTQSYKNPVKNVSFENYALFFFFTSN